MNALGFTPARLGKTSQDVARLAQVNGIMVAFALCASFVTKGRGSTAPQCSDRKPVRPQRLFDAPLGSSPAGAAVDLQRSQ